MDNSHSPLPSQSILIEKDTSFFKGNATESSLDVDAKRATTERYFCENDALNKIVNKLLSDFKQVEAQYNLITHRLYEHQQEGKLTKGWLLNEVFNALNQLKQTEEGKQLRTFWRILLHPDHFTQLIGTEGGRELDIASQLSQADKSEIFRILHAAARKVLDKNGTLADKLSREIVARDQLEMKQTRELITTIRQFCLQHEALKAKKKVYMVLEGAPAIYLPLDRKLAKRREKQGFSVNLQQTELALEDLRELAFITTKDVIDKSVLLRNVREVMGNNSEITLKEVVDAKTITSGLSELLGYVNLLTGWDKHRVNTQVVESILFDMENQKYLELPQIVFAK